jgi:XTP/dITP diphosphohydrolase
VTAPSTRVLLATKNPGKVRELARILAPWGLELEGASYEPGPETGATFAENALAKAREGVAHTGLPTVADDSGLTVDDQANLDLLLGQLSDVPDGRRGGAFVCAAAYALPDGRSEVVLGEMRGSIIREARGTNGFGYDPVFVPVGYAVTSAELDADEKDAISHRGQAFRALAPLLAEALGQ